MKKLFVILGILFALFVLLPRQTGHEDGADRLVLSTHPVFAAKLNADKNPCVIALQEEHHENAIHNCSGAVYAVRHNIKMPFLEASYGR